MAVKKALIAVSGCLQDHPAVENLPTNFSRPIESSSSRESRNVLDPQAELFPNLSFLLPQKSCDNVAVSDKDADGARKEVVFRLLCSNVSAGSVIGRKGAIVRDLENETGATIRFSAPTGGFGDRIVTISASEVSHDYSLALYTFPINLFPCSFAANCCDCLFGRIRNHSTLRRKTLLFLFSQERLRGTLRKGFCHTSVRGQLLV